MAKKEEKEPIVHQVEKLEDLLHTQQRLLGLAGEIIEGKTKLIDLCEMEIELYRKENKRLRTSLIISAVLFAIVGVINVIRLIS